jgi:oxygen-dependent protoporphyrinogen oxidase
VTTHVVVAGGGVAGLAAARALVLASDTVTVTVLEADTRTGGKLHTTPFAGRLVDEGADAFLLRVPEALAVCPPGADLVHPAARTAYIWSRGGLHPLPPQLMGVPTDLDALEASGLLSPDGLARAQRDLTDPPSPELTGDQSIASVIERRLGPEVVDRLVDPLVGGINAGDVRELSIDTVVPQLAAAAKDPDHASFIEACRAQQGRSTADPAAPIFASPRAGMGELVTWLHANLAASGRATIETGRRVDQIEPATNGGWLVHAGDAPIEADAVIVATPAYASAAMLGAAAPDAAGTLAAIDHASVAIVTFALRPDDIGRPLDRSGFLVPRVEPTAAMTACSFSSTKWAHLAAEAGDGTVVVRASAGRAGDPSALDQDDNDLVAALLDDLARTIGLAGEPAGVRVSRWPRSFPQYRPGHLDRIAAAEATLPPTIALAGAALRGVGVPACIRSGNAAATRVLTALRP